MSQQKTIPGSYKLKNILIGKDKVKSFRRKQALHDCHALFLSALHVVWHGLRLNSQVRHNILALRIISGL